MQSSAYSCSRRDLELHLAATDDDDDDVASDADADAAYSLVLLGVILRCQWSVNTSAATFVAKEEIGVLIGVG